MSSVGRFGDFSLLYQQHYQCLNSWKGLASIQEREGKNVVFCHLLLISFSAYVTLKCHNPIYIGDIRDQVVKKATNQPEILPTSRRVSLANVHNLTITNRKHSISVDQKTSQGNRSLPYLISQGIL